MTAFSKSFQATKSIRYGVATFLALSSGLLTSLIPGGAIETRSFAHINPLILASFNTFLTTLSLASLLLIYFVWQGYRWAFVASFISGLSYFLVYVLDLGHLFPVSPDAMPIALLTIEVLGTIVSFPLMLISVSGVQSVTRQLVPNNNYQLKLDLARTQQVVMAIAIILIGMGIITFATRSAMGL
ncbi:MAG: hypothetical protein AAGA80_20710 [Cyanobacteria bacterium P01_F01_bin.143]